MRYEYEDFKDTITELVREHYTGEDGYTVKLNKVSKNNGIALDGMTICSNQSNVAPNIYLNFYYKDYENGVYESIEEVVDAIIKCYEVHRPTESFDVSCFSDFSKMKHLVRMKVLDKDMNEELLKECPYFTYLNKLAVLFYIQLPSAEEGEYPTIAIRQEHLEMWGITKDELLAVAKSQENIDAEEYQIEDMFSVLNGMLDIPEEMQPEFDCSGHMFVLTNSRKLNGASIILHLEYLESLANKLNSSLYILPSSIHECIAIAAPDGASEENDYSQIQNLREMIREVNRTQVQLMERLSDELFYFDRTTKLLSIA